MKNKNTNKSQIILGIILFVIIIICSIYVETSNNSNYNENTNNLYSNLNIDKSKLNIVYLNVGQADSTLITMGEEVMLIDAGNEKDGKYIVFIPVSDQGDIEDENGKLVNPDSWFVLPYYNVSGRTVVGGTATCSFNVRVRELEDGNIKIQINLNNVVGYYIIEWFNSFYLRKEVVETTIPQECKSTGKFEADLLALFNE